MAQRQEFPEQAFQDLVTAYRFFRQLYVDLSTRAHAAGICFESDMTCANFVYKGQRLPFFASEQPASTMGPLSPSAPAHPAQLRLVHPHAIPLTSQQFAVPYSMHQNLPPNHINQHGQFPLGTANPFTFGGPVFLGNNNHQKTKGCKQKR